MKRCLFFFLLSVFLAPAWAQMVTGRVVDGKTGNPIPYVNVHYEGTTVGVNTDAEGNFSVRKMAGNTLTFSFVGYEKTSVLVNNETRELSIKLKPSSVELKSIVVKGKRKRYSRKENPAVELMRKVIAAKKTYNLKNNDYFSYDQYRKTTFSINEFTEKVFEEGSFKNMPFLKDHVETCAETGKLILPVSVMEETSRYIYRKKPESEKTIVTGKRDVGLNQLLNTGDILNEVISDCFTDVNIYDENVRLLQYPFISPISTHYAIGFYHFFLGDTLFIGNDRCIEVDFVPANPQDFGFMGNLYIYADSTYRIRKTTLHIPRRSDVNYVEDLRIEQEFVSLPGGEQVLASDKMLVQLKVTNYLTKFQVERRTHYNNFSTEDISDREFKFLGPTYTVPNAMLQDQTFWNKHRPEELTQGEGRMEDMLRKMKEIKHFNVFLIVIKAFMENFVETSSDPDRPSKVDIGPINTTITQNFVDGLRLRASAQTTANLNKHLFAKGYLAYGFKDERWKGMGQMTYSFNEKSYLPREFPMHNITLSVHSDVVSPSDKFMPTDKDNVFTSFKWTKVDQMMYFKRVRLRYEREFQNGLRIESEYTREQDEPTGKLFYQRLDGGGAPLASTDAHRRYLNISDVKIGCYYQPHAKYINTKQRRITVNRDSPCYWLSHTVGFNGLLGGQHAYNLTEMSVYKRFWIPSAGKIDMKLNLSAQWNKVPYPLLIMPPANLSFIKEPETLSMVDNMEFLNDRSAFFMFSWDLNGKIFNRIPLLRKLKWREYIGCNVLWGTLTDKNNPFVHTDDRNLYYFPGRFDSQGQYRYSSYVMDNKKPYYELLFGVHNVFKILHIEAVRRMNYMENENAHKWGFRVMLNMSF